MPRESYFLNIYSQVSDFFSEYVAPSMGRSNTLMLQSGRSVLPWYFPIGVLRDIYAGKSSGQPWILVASTSVCPHIPIPTLATFHTTYMGLLKISEQINHGGITAINNLDRRKLQELYGIAERGATHLNIRDFLPLLTPSSSQLSNTPTPSKNIAVRLHVFNTTSQISFTRLLSAPAFITIPESSASSLVENDKETSLAPVKTSPSTIRSLLTAEIGPELLSQFEDQILGCESSLNDAYLSRNKPQKLELLFCGVDAPLDATLMSLQEFGSTDGSIHLVLRGPDRIVGGGDASI